ncbi:MAG TPA: hypothetical protein VFX18_04305 [Candidatus Nitrosocosmicus sp.]|nr:hypothetical protein [Candidatus Nitrosocosmicus sp.]
MSPLELRIRKISILLGLAITEKIILTRLDVDSKIPRLVSDGGKYVIFKYKKRSYY